MKKTVVVVVFIKTKWRKLVSLLPYGNATISTVSSEAAETPQMNRTTSILHCDLALTLIHWSQLDIFGKK